LCRRFNSVSSHHSFRLCLIGRTRTFSPEIVKTLHLYLTRQVVASLLMTLAVFTLLLLLGNVLRDVLSMFVNRQATAGMLIMAVALLIPFVWVFALPMATLTATLLVFGRFSADNELTAARASGISLLSLATPILVLSLFLCGICAAVNMEIAPRCRVAYNNIGAMLKANLANMRFPENRYIRDFDGYVIYIGKNRDQKLEDVMVVTTDETSTTTIRAPRGQIRKDESGTKILVDLFDAKSLMTVSDHSYPSASGTLTLTLNLDNGPGKPRAPQISDMTFGQLRAELKDLKKRIKLPAAMVAAQDADKSPSKRRNDAQFKDIATPLRVQMHQQVASSFACFSFALVGIPLAIRVQRRETNVSFAVSLALVVVYYAFLFLGKSLSDYPEIAPHLLVWLPNFIFLAAGSVLLWRTNRGD
jgi:lipopolysaccharide export system permease protein